MLRAVQCMGAGNSLYGNKKNKKYVEEEMQEMHFDCVLIVFRLFSLGL